MKYYEFDSPFYALIKAPNERKAKAIYKKYIWAAGCYNCKERSRDYALMKFAMAHDSKTNDVIFKLNQFLEENSDVLLIDANTG
ncbi:hypothetical protein HNR44_001121 [Geomicrobium halophilum]|uniref:Uncharacterized protein n=1 Tax=Geomicrobium halophilum TaxID=549000 RepID=A0A841PY39_9BACL|nr:hypothetical protein [Geomicrobium halophilum]MBB6449172.1 hypothetical protein [Geomicrobium halophilum]